MLHRKSFIIAVLLTPFQLFASDHFRQNSDALNSFFSNGSKSALLTLGIQENDKGSETLKKRLRAALKSRETQGNVYENYSFLLDSPDAKEDPDYEKNLKLYKEAKKNYEDAKAQVRKLQAEMRTDAQWAVETGLLQKILQNALMEKGGKTWIKEGEIKIPLTAEEKEAFIRLRDWELGGLWSSHPIGSDVVIEEGQLTLKKLLGWQLESYASEFKLYLKTASKRGIFKEEVEKWAQWGLKTTVRYEEFKKIFSLQIINPEDYIDLKSND